MPKKRTKKNDSLEGEGRDGTPALDLHPQTKKWIAGIFFATLGIIVLLSFLDQAGVVGGWIDRGLTAFFGWGAVFAPLLLFLAAFLFFRAVHNVYVSTVLGSTLFLVSSLALLEVIGGEEARRGGVLGHYVALPLLHFLGPWATSVIFFAVAFVAFFILFNYPQRVSPPEEEEDREAFAEKEKAPRTEVTLVGKVLDRLRSSGAGFVTKPLEGSETLMKPLSKRRLTSEEEEKELPQLAERIRYTSPPLDLLEKDRGKPTTGDIKANANIIKRTLANFSIEVEMGEVSIGPTVTQFTLKPAEGVKLAKITTLQNDLSLALAAHPIRIEAPIPGRSLVGIEIPNHAVTLVRLQNLLEQEAFKDAPQRLTFALGRGVDGAPFFASLEKMPHLLIAGATGTGKTICLNSLMMSLLFRNPPDYLRFILIDPKRVEFSVYNNIPHLLTPVITDVQRTVNALRWAVMEMDRRFDLLSSARARDIGMYNRERKPQEEPLPYIVVIIDELADLMASRGRDIEAAIVRLAQMARAVGIHLVVATQRPSVEVITGLIKANITSRIAFQVASQVDSRTVIDMAGAERLLGNGDLLFMSAETAKPRRFQGAYISEKEVRRVTEFLKKETQPDYREEIVEPQPEQGEALEEGEYASGDDPLYEEAKRLVIQARKASASYLQRRLRVGYARAARLIDILEENGVVGPGEGAKPREILLALPERKAEEGEEGGEEEEKF